jgi:hypothetical protein
MPSNRDLSLGLRGMTLPLRMAPAWSTPAKMWSSTVASCAVMIAEPPPSVSHGMLFSMREVDHSVLGCYGHVLRAGKHRKPLCSLLILWTAEWFPYFSHLCASSSLVFRLCLAAYLSVSGFRFAFWSILSTLE